MTRNELLMFSTLGDAKEHSFTELFITLNILLKRFSIRLSKEKLSKMLKKAVEYHQIRPSSLISFDKNRFILTRKGDEYFRSEQIRHTNDSTLIYHYKNFEKNRAR